MFSRLCLFLALAVGCRSAAHPQAAPEKQALFVGGVGGYKLYRIPGIVVTKRGTVLVYCEARKKTGSDWDTIDILLRRSNDGGRSFSEPVSIAHVSGPITRNPVALEQKHGSPDDVTYNNPVGIPDRDGTVHFLFALNYMRVFYMSSPDDGRHFSQPVEITSTFESLRSAFPWKAVATGPGHGIQLSNGRLVVPCWIGLGTERSGHGPSVNTTIYSDDHGQTWHTDGIAIPNSATIRSANETEAVELAYGRVMLNARAGADVNRRVVTVGPDGRDHWAEAWYQEDLPDPHCMAGFVRFSTVQSGGRNRLLFSNPDNLTRADGKPTSTKDRRNLTIKLSYNEGKTWPVKRTLEPGPAGYSDLAVTREGAILCFYEASRDGVNGGSSERLLLARFHLRWLAPEDPDSTNKGNQ